MPDIQPDDPRSDVAAAWDSVTKEAEAAPEPVAEVAVPAAPVGRPSEDTQATDTRARDEKGRFAAKIGDAPKEAKPPVEEKVEAPAEPPKVEAKEEPKPPAEPPKPKF